MLKKIAILVLILIGGYLLLQVPAVKNYTDQFKADITKSKDRVVSEYEKQQENLNSLKTTVSETVDTVKKVQEGISETAETLGKAADAINGAVSKVKGDMGSTPAEEQ
ncbi:hypothetical protein JXA05_00920 [Candidatus Peregrinibacteria bacterium]|nr:hypothetical protein [Candidatus Peregrinibacteria bacterium]